MPNPNPPSLRELQQAFAASLVDDPARGLHPWIAARGLDPEARLRIYRHAGYAIHVEALEAVFPVTRAFVGAESFDGLATRYSARHGSRSGNLQAFGDAFPGFLRMQPETADWPWLGDVATLESLRQQCLLAADGGPAQDRMLRTLAAAGEGPVWLRLAPHVRLMRARSPVLDLWRYGRAPQVTPQPDPAGDAQCVLLWRDGHAVRECAVSVTQADFIAALRDGVDVMRALVVAGVDPEDPRTLADMLHRLLEHALICSADMSPPEVATPS
jgi:hypothetical protein